ncbi:MAG: Flp family type IVb pilin [Myxococcota bacterium]
MRSVRAFLREEGGSTAIEYGMIASLVILVAMAAMYQVGDRTVAMWNNIAAHIR